ncbi:hypothetical protein ACFQHO_31190 [Actinomadura yumaensis]
MVGAGYWGPNLVRNAQATPRCGWNGCATWTRSAPAPSSAATPPSA